MKLTPRLQAVAELVPHSSCVADIGTDHAYIPISLIHNGRIDAAIAGDIHAGPAQRARKHIDNEGLSKKIEVREGSGLQILKKNEAEGAVIAGMGGLMIKDILLQGNDVADGMKWLVLQPQNHISDLRIWLQKNGYKIDREVLVKEGTQLYEILYVTHGVMAPFTILEAEIGNTESRFQDRLFITHLNKLIAQRNMLLEHISKETIKPVNMKKRQKALEDKTGLEEVLWKFM